MGAKDTVSVRLEPDLNDRIMRMAREKGMNYSDALRYALRFGIDRIERGHDILDAARFVEYMHDLLRYVIKIDIVLQKGLVRQLHPTREALESFYAPIVSHLEKKGFRRPIIMSKDGVDE